MNAGSLSEETLSTPPSISMMQYSDNNVDTAWLPAAAAAPYFQHEQGEGEWR